MGPASMSRARVEPRGRRAVAATAAAALLFAAFLLLVYGTRPVLQLDVGGDARASLDGFYAAERLGELRWVWTAPRAAVVLPGVDRSVPWHWKSRILLNRLGTPTLRVSIDGVVAVEQVVSEKHQVVEAEIKARPGTRGLILTLDTTPGFSPGNGDPRALGLAFESMELAPLSGRVWPEASLFLWGLSVIVVVGATLTILGVRPVVLYGGLALAAVGQAWWLGRAGTIYGPYPASTIAWPVGYWFAIVVGLRAYDWLPGALLRWRERTGPRRGTGVLTNARHMLERWLERPALRRAYAVAAYALLAGFFVHALAFWGRGIIDKEAMAFVLNYWADRPLLPMIFDPKLNDWGAYQARELSYLFDLVDARVFGTLLSRGMLLFVPLSGVVGLFAVTGLYLWGATRILRLDRVSAGLFAALFLSCYVTQASTAILYRSAKISLSLALLASLFLVTTLIRREQGSGRTPVWRVFGVFVLGVTMSLCDRQGYFLSAALTGIVGLLWLTSRLRRERPAGHHVAVVIAGIAACVVSTLYNYVFAPAIIRWANGYSPSFEYQQLPLEAASRPLFVHHAWNLVRLQSSYFFGNAPFWAVVILALIGWMATNWASRAAGQTRSTAMALLTDDVLMVTAAGVAAMVMLYGAMVLRHPQVYAIPDHRLWYYWTPMHVAILFGATLWISKGSGSGRRWGLAAAHVLVLIMMAGNVAHYGEQRTVMVTSARWFKHQYERTQRIVQVHESTSPAGSAAAERQYLQRVREAVAKLNAARR